MKLLLYPHGGSGNHGCEAIVRSTLKMIPTATLFSSNPDEDKRYGLDAICTLRAAQAPMSHLSLAYWKAFIRYRFGDKEAFDRTSFRSIFQEANSYNPQIEMFARFKMKSSFHKTKRII